MNNATEMQMPVRLRGQMLNQIYRVWLFRKLLPVLIFEVILLTFVLYQLGKTIFIQRILENALNVFFINPANIISFTVSAFEGASLLNRILALVGVAVIALIIRHLTQGMLRLFLIRENYFSKIKK